MFNDDDGCGFIVDKGSESAKWEGICVLLVNTVSHTEGTIWIRMCACTVQQIKFVYEGDYDVNHT